MGGAARPIAILTKGSALSIDSGGPRLALALRKAYVANCFVQIGRSSASHRNRELACTRSTYRSDGDVAHCLLVVGITCYRLHVPDEDRTHDCTVT